MEGAAEGDENFAVESSDSEVKGTKAEKLIVNRMLVMYEKQKGEVGKVEILMKDTQELLAEMSELEKPIKRLGRSARLTRTATLKH